MSACRCGALLRFRRWRLPRQYTSRQQRRLGKQLIGIHPDRVYPGVQLQPIQCSEKYGSLTRPPAQHQCLRGAPLKRLLVAIHACAACATALQPRVRVQCRSGSPNDDIVLLFACAIRSICSAVAAEPSHEEIIESLLWPNVERTCSRAMTDAFVRHRDSPGNPVFISAIRLARPESRRLRKQALRRAWAGDGQVVLGHV